MTARRALLALIPALLAGCVAPGSEDGGLGMRVLNLTGSGPESGLPADADTLRILVMDGDTVLQDYSRSVVSIEDLDGNGSTDRELAVEIPPDRPVSVTIHAKQALTLLATARIDNVEVTNGARRYVSVAFTKVRSVYGTEPLVPGGGPALPQLPTGRFGHGAARIESDGRVLVTGGFTAASPTPCPAELASSVVCFQLTATNEAYLINPADFSVSPTRSPMLRARALHTTTALGDGRVLVAGGVDSAVLGLERIEGVMGAFEYRPHIIATSPTVGQSARTFEIFDPQIGAELVDEGRDGDPLAGAFIGAPGEPTTPGNMNTERYLHAASLIPGSDTDVLVVGGQGSAEAPVSAELFQLDRAGGSGFEYPPSYFADTGVERIWPAAAPSATSVYVIGGAFPPTGANNLLEQWTQNAAPAAGGTFTDLMSCATWDRQARPRNALVGAQAVVFGRIVQRVLVSGWLGPLCSTPAEGLPATQEAYDGTVACASTNYSSRSFTLGTLDCSFGAIQTPDVGRFLGSVAAMPNGQAIMAGGFSDGALNVTRSVELLTGEFTDGSNLAVRNSNTQSMGRGRAWFTSTTLAAGRVLMVGGMNFTFGADLEVPNGIQTSTAVEVYDPGWDPAEAATP